MALGLPPAQWANGVTPQKGGIKPRSNQSRSAADMVTFNFIGAAFRITSSYHERSYACGGRSGGAVNCQDLPKPEQCKTAGEPNVPPRRQEEMGGQPYAISRGAIRQKAAPPV